MTTSTLESPPTDDASRSTGESRDPAPRSIGLRIRAARERQAISVATLARRIGVEPGTVAAWEADQRAPRASRLPAITGILDVSLPWLLQGREDGSLAPRLPSLGDLRRDLDGIAQTLAELSSMLESARERLGELERG